jgi:uncharacterized repeat protein (TIGR02543 family)
VVYHASGAAKGSTGTLDIQSDEDPLASTGFSPSNTWDLSAADAAASASGAAADGALSVQSEGGANLASGSDVRVALVERDDMSVADLVSQLQSLDFVECAAPNYLYEIDEDSESASSASTSTPAVTSAAYPASGDDAYTPQGTLTNDTYLDMQYALVDSAGSMGYQGALAAEKSGTTNNVVAVLDTGVDYDNPDLSNQMWDNPGSLGLGDAGTHGYNAWANTYDPMPGSASHSSCHGTHVAGIIAAQSNNATGVASIAGANSHTKIMGLRGSDDAGSGIPAASVAACYEYVVRAKLANVNVVAVNNSWSATGASTYDSVLDYLVNQAGKAGILSVFGSGNDGKTTENQFETTMLESPYLIGVGASNQYDDLASYSSYNETSIDVTAPGSQILSTVPDSACGYYFSPLLSKLAGKDLDIWSDVGSLCGTSGFSVKLTDSKGTALSDEAQAALTYAPSADGASTIPAGQKSLKVTVDFGNAALKTDLDNKGLTASDVRATMSWTMANPFQGKTGLEASDYAAGVTVAGIGFDTSQRVAAYERLLTPGGANLVTDNSFSFWLREGYQIERGGALGSATLTALDTTDGTLAGQVAIRFSSGTSTPPQVPMSCLVTGYGVGRDTNPYTDTTSDFVPYAFDSGTSMASPMIAGSIAELAALHPGYSALQLRGIICGGTEALSTAEAQAKIASGGRFTFDDALDNSKVNANTWSITTSGDQVTVHGYNLLGAKLYVDDTSHETVTATGTQADSITFTAASSLLDGTRHRFDVTGANGRTYKAAYVTPSVAPDSLARVRDLPTSDDAGTGKLVSATDRMFYADGQGAFLYSCADPSDATSTWTKLAAPGTPWAGTAASGNRVPMAFTYCNGKLYAFAADDVPATQSAAEQAAFYCSTYDIASGTWSGFSKIGASDTVDIGGLSATSGNGLVCAWAYTETDTASSGVLLAKAPGSESFAQAAVSLASADVGLPYQTYVTNGSLYGIGYGLGATEGTYTLDLAQFDPLSAPLAAADKGLISGYATTTNLYKIFSYETKVMTAVGNGIVVAADTDFGLGDLQLVNTSTISATKLGSYGLTSADGLTVGSMAMLRGKLYLQCVGHEGTSAKAASQSASSYLGIYTLPSAPAAEVATTDVTAAAESDGRGSATVSDWRGSADSSLAVRGGDTATWTAAAENGSTFVGWYDADGNLVSSDETYAAIATADRTLTARFTQNAAPTPTPATTPTPGTTDSGISDSDAYGSATSTPNTGDSSLPFALAVIALVVGGVTVTAAWRMSRNLHE